MVTESASAFSIREFFGLDDKKEEKITTADKSRETTTTKESEEKNEARLGFDELQKIIAIIN
ncbi:MAG: hypothetical protein V3V89_00450 [Gammaproteobacteria bacterium]